MTAQFERPQPEIHDDVLINMDAVVATWVQMKLGEPPLELVAFKAFAVMPSDDEGTKRVLKQIENNEPPSFLAAAYFFNHYPGEDIYVSVASDDINSGHPRIIKKILNYPFGQLNLPRVSARIHDSNQKCIENAIKLGFVLEGRKAGTGWQMWGLERSKCWIWNNVKDAA